MSETIQEQVVQSDCELGVRESQGPESSGHVVVGGNDGLWRRVVNAQGRQLHACGTFSGTFRKEGWSSHRGLPGESRI